MTDNELSKLRALTDSATPGPWSAMPFDDCSRVYSGEPLKGRLVVISPYEYNPRDEEDAAFIAAARTAVPALIGEVERLRADLSRLTRNARNEADQYRAKSNNLRRLMLEAQKERDSLRREVKRLQPVEGTTNHE